MNYQQTIAWVFSQLPMYQQQGASAYKEDLTNTNLLCNYLSHPQQALKTIHVAGTNGKGSTSSMLASILQEAGYKVGLFTSPHLKDYRERIKINGQMISETFVVSFFEKHKPFFEQHQLSFFEMTVGLAFKYFEEEKVDVAIIETGLGGRLDATNIITPMVSIITNIGLDHMQFLGHTPALIAAEKAGIIKPEIPVVIGEYTPETKTVFINKANQVSAPLFFSTNFPAKNFPSDLLGDYQENNKKTVLQTLEIIKPFFKINENHIAKGFLQVVKNTGLLGRWQQINTSPRVICDTAHNSHGLKIVLNQLQKQTYDRLIFILGVVNDKDLNDILPLFPKQAYYIFTKPNIPRGLDATILKEQAEAFGLLNNQVIPTVSEAYAFAKQYATPNDLIYIGGSTFVVAEIV